MKKLSVAAFAEELITTGGKRLISVPGMVETLRTTYPECEHNDDELRQLVSMIAVSKGCDLAFNRPRGFDVDA